MLIREVVFSSKWKIRIRWYGLGLSLNLRRADSRRAIHQSWPIETVKFRIVMGGRKVFLLLSSTDCDILSLGEHRSWDLTWSFSSTAVLCGRRLEQAKEVVMHLFLTKVRKLWWNCTAHVSIERFLSSYDSEWKDEPCPKEDFMVLFFWFVDNKFSLLLPMHMRERKFLFFSTKKVAR